MIQIMIQMLTRDPVDILARTITGASCTYLVVRICMGFIAS